MESRVISDQSLQHKLVMLADVASRLERLGQDLLSLAGLRQLLEQLQTERSQLQQRVQQLQDECDRLKLERSQLLHAWADMQITDEELERRSREPGGCSLSEILERLERA